MSRGGLYWIASYPKSGNTWMRAFIQNLRGDPAVPASINEINVGRLASSREWLDDLLGVPTADLHQDEIASLRRHANDWMAHEAAEPDYCKIHDACERDAQGQPRLGAAARGALYIVRNPLDVVASAANHWACSLDVAIDRMNDDDALFAVSRCVQAQQVPQSLSSWSSHVLGWVDAPPCPLLALRYEDLLDTPQAAFGRAAAFLGLPCDAARIERAWHHCRFEELAAQEAAGGFRERGRGDRFFRRGRAGGWRDELDAAQVARIVARHAVVMRRFGYLDRDGSPA
jgi:aryl sulfotransferase